MDSAQQNAGIDIAVQAENADCAAVPSARCFFQIFDRLGGGLFRSSNHGDGPHVGEECIEGVEAGQKRAAHMIDRMEQSGIRFDQAASNYLDGTGNADARFIVAIDIAAHGELRFLLVELSNWRMFSASVNGSPERRAVPAMGQDSTRSPSTRTNISGDAPINCSLPSCRKNS